MYARGLIRRLVTNEINIGLSLEAEPNNALLDSLSDEASAAWTDDVESRFELWGENPELCDYEGRRTFPELQEELRTEALVEGDVLVVLRRHRKLGLPQIQIIRGGRVQTPTKHAGDSRIVQGVKVDKRNRHLGFYVSTRGDGLSNDSTYIPAKGERTGRRMAWLVYGTDRRMDQVRGTPLLGLVAQSIKEMDIYRDNEQRASTINSSLAMWIEKTEDKPGTLPMSGGAALNLRATGTGFDGEAREFNAAGQVPGMVIEELQMGEKPHSFDTTRPNINYPVFEAAILNAIAWSCEVPPEILTLSFQSNYSASKAAINEFKAYITKVRAKFSRSFCQPVYVEWLAGEVLGSRIPAPGFLEARRDVEQYEIFGAWIRSQWGGPIKPSVEMRKDVQGYVEAIAARLCTHDRASKDLFGVRFDRVVQRLEKEEDSLEAAGLGLEVPEEVIAPGGGDAGFTNAQEDTVIELVREEITADATN
tara:strand:+ start:3522 stop:4952 length:1431 start_codon:yes stop_codon:yes gene_type:complete